MSSRVAHVGLRRKIMSAADAAAHIRPGDNVGMSGFTGAGYPKAVPQALAARSPRRPRTRRGLQGSVCGRAPPPPRNSTAPWPRPTASSCACPTSPTRSAVPRSTPGTMDYLDVHLSHVAQMVWQGFFGPPRRRAGRGRGDHRGRRADPFVARSATTRRGSTRPNGSSSRSTRGSRSSWRACTTSITAPRCPRTANRSMIMRPSRPDRRARTSAARRRRSSPIVRDRQPRPQPALQAARTSVSAAIAGHLIDFLRARGQALAGCPRRCCRCSPASAISPMPCWPDWTERPLRPLTAYTEVIQDGMLDLIESGTIDRRLGHRVLAQP